MKAWRQGKTRTEERGTSDGSGASISSAHRGPPGPDCACEEKRATGQAPASAARIEARQGRIAPALLGGGPSGALFAFDADLEQWFGFGIYDVFGDDTFHYVVTAGQLVHHVNQHIFENRPEATGAGAS